MTLYDGATAIGTGKANASGAWSIKSTTLAGGVHAVKARATDLAGNVSVFSSALRVAIDTAAPPAPSKPDLGVNSDSGASNTDNITRITTPVFTGTGEEIGSSVTLYDGAAVIGTSKANALGAWSIKSSTLTSGVHGVKARVTDLAGNVSAFSGTLQVTIDTTTPAAPSESNLAGGNHHQRYNAGVHRHGRGRHVGNAV